MSRPLYEGSFRYRFMEENLLDRRAEVKRPWVREGALPRFMTIYLYSTYSIHIRRYMSIDITFSFLFIDKLYQNIRFHRLYVFVHTHLTWRKKGKRDPLMNIKSLQSARVLRIRATIRLCKKHHQLDRKCLFWSKGERVPYPYKPKTSPKININTIPTNIRDWSIYDRTP